MVSATRAMHEPENCRPLCVFLILATVSGAGLLAFLPLFAHLTPGLQFVLAYLVPLALAGLGCGLTVWLCHSSQQLTKKRTSRASGKMAGIHTGNVRRVPAVRDDSPKITS